MRTETSDIAPGTVVITARADRGREHRFFTGMAVLALLIALVGFAPTYYLRGFTAAPPLTGLVHLHGALATSWLLLFLAQTSTVLAGRTDIHRRLGLAVAAVGGLFVVVGYLTAVEGARQGVAPPGMTQPGFLAIPLAALVSFAVLAGLGIAWRRRRETHRRLMLLATIAILIPAFARFRWLGIGGPAVGVAGTCLLVLAFMVWDRRVHGRIHPALLWGGGLLVLSLPARLALARSETWVEIARWLTR